MTPANARALFRADFKDAHELALAEPRYVERALAAGLPYNMRARKQGRQRSDGVAGRCPERKHGDDRVPGPDIGSILEILDEREHARVVEPVRPRAFIRRIRE